MKSKKAAPSLTRLLLGILDKAELRLGDNTTVNFEKSLIFFTSNLGAMEMMKEIQPDFGFQAGIPPQSVLKFMGKIQNVAFVRSPKKRFSSPEFVNRIDAIVTYQPLDAESVDDNSEPAHRRTAETRKTLDWVTAALRLMSAIPVDSFLLEKGTSTEYGARELKTHTPSPDHSAAGDDGGRGQKSKRAESLKSKLNDDKDGLTIIASKSAEPVRSGKLKVMLVDDNIQLLAFLEAFANRSRLGSSEGRIGSPGSGDICKGAA